MPRMQLEFMLTDQKDYFLSTTIERPESMKVPYTIFQITSELQHKLDDIVTHEVHIYCKIDSMHGLK